MDKFRIAENSIILRQIIDNLIYVIIGIFVIPVVLWIIYGIKKFKWAKTTAITLTVVAVIIAIIFSSRFLFPRLTQDRRQKPGQKRIYTNSLTDHVKDTGPLFIQ